MTSDELAQWTCGKGLAASAALPAKVGELMRAMAEVLERHTKALDPDEPAGREERRAYESLVWGFRDVAARLTGMAEEIKGYRDLPVARHDAAVMADPSGQVEAFGRMVAVERELAVLLEEKVREAEQMTG